MTSRTFTCIAAMAAAAAVAAGCGGGSDGGDTTTSAATGTQGAGATKLDCPDGTLRIGMAKAKTGGFALFDKPGGQGSLVAVDQVNADGGIDGCKLEVDWQDTKSDAATGGQVADGLIKDGAKVLIAPSDFDAGIGASLAAQKAKVFGMSPEASSVDWPKAAGPSFVVQAITTEDLGNGQATFADQQGWKNAYVVTNEAFDFFKQMEKVFQARFQGEVVGRSAVADDASDYAAVVSRIRSTNPKPDVIYLNDYFPHVGTFIKQLRAAGIDTPVLGNPTYSSPDLAKAIGPSRTKDVYFASQSFYEGKDVAPDVAAFVKAYQDKFGTFPENSNAIAGYEGVLLLVAALEQAHSTDAAALMQAMTEQRDVQLPGAEVYGWKDGATQRSVTIVGLDGADFVEVERLDPSER